MSDEPTKKKAKFDGDDEKEKDPFVGRGSYTGSEISSSPRPAWTEDLHGTWAVAYIENVPDNDFELPVDIKLELGKHGETATITGNHRISGRLTMGAFCERVSMDALRQGSSNPSDNKEETPICLWSFGWQPTEKALEKKDTIDWFQNYAVDQDSGEIGVAEAGEGYIEFTFDGRSINNCTWDCLDESDIEQLPESCLVAHYHLSDEDFDKIILCRPTDLHHVRRVICASVLRWLIDGITLEDKPIEVQAKIRTTLSEGAEEIICAEEQKAEKQNAEGKNNLVDFHVCKKEAERLEKLIAKETRELLRAAD